VHNDGFYDIMLKVLGYAGQEILLYPGSDSIEPFGGQVIHVDDAAATWSFSVR
jgi:hypothetical protein